MPFRRSGRDSIPAVAVSIAHQCSENFNPDSVALKDYSDWMRLYLLANRDDAADLVAQRRITSARQQSKSPRDLYDVLTGMIEVYGDVRPIRWDKVQSTGAMLEAKGVAPGPVELWRVYATLYNLADSVGDTTARRRNAEQMLVVAETFPAEVRNAMEFFFVRFYNFQAKNFLTQVARMDSLRKGPEPYLALMRANWHQVDTADIAPLPQAIGKSAPRLTADFWATSNTTPLTTTTDHPRPSPGKISLVLFLRAGCNQQTPMFVGGLDRATHVRPCWATYASLRRLAQRFPSLEITLVTRTMGYTGNTSPMEPREEALMLQKWWLGYHKLPVTLAVANTQFFRLEAFDHRRIDSPVENDVNYLFDEGQETEVSNQMAYLIDTNGSVLLSSNVAYDSEIVIAEMLDVMTHRGQ